MDEIVLETGESPKIGPDLTAQCDKVTLSLLRLGTFWQAGQCAPDRFNKQPG